MQEDLLSIANLHSGYGVVPVLKDVSLNVAAGSITALVGSNGAGKTTLMRCIAGLLAPWEGSTSYAGEQIDAWPTHRRVAEGIALVPEGRKIFPDFTVEQNLRIGGFACGGRGRLEGEMAERLERVYGLFPRLRERRRQLGDTLSGGEQQMVALGRGLMSSPRLLLLDEPTLGLAPLLARSLFDNFVQIRETGVTIFLAEQDVRSTLAVADHAYVLETGRLVLDGPGQVLLDDGKVKQAYLGL